MLHSINLSISSACGADCLFCPAERGGRIALKIMPFEVAAKIIDEMASREFSSKHKVELFQIGENGDAFLNKDAIRILRYLRLRMPSITVHVSTNFHNLTPDKADIIVSERLVDHVTCNIDGSNERNYRLMKGLSLETARKNIIGFLEARRRFKKWPDLTIYVITAAYFIGVIRQNFGFLPGKLKDAGMWGGIPDDFEDVRKEWRPLLDFRKDKINRLSVFGWCERGRFIDKSINYEAYKCPFLHRVKTEAFIAPDGSWYICCLDGEFSTIFGNVFRDSIDAVYEGAARKRAIELLEKRKFGDIGGPCRTVNCCVYLPYESRLRRIVKMFIVPKKVTKPLPQ